MCCGEGQVGIAKEGKKVTSKISSINVEYNMREGLHIS
jgi:hypothetical protein